MIPAREFEILAHLYGRQDGRVVCLSNAYYQDAGDYAGAWVGPGIVYYPGPEELIVTQAEAIALAAAKSVCRGVGFELVPTAAGRERYKRLLREVAP